VRVGARSGYWYVEQKTARGQQPSVLARAPIRDGGLPARVRVVLKGGAAIVHINGLMQFGKALRLHPDVDRGRLLLGVYDSRSRQAQAVLTGVKAARLGERWIAPKRGEPGGFESAALEALREEAVVSRALSPRWISIAADGRVRVDESQSVLIRSLAGFYACRVIPMADFPPLGPSVLGDAAAARRLVGALGAAAAELDAVGLNLLLRGRDADRPETAAFLARLRDELRSRNRELWITVDGPAGPAVAASVDGVLRPSQAPRPGLERLEAVTIQ
jgi:hypothetical protein